MVLAKDLSKLGPLLFTFLYTTALQVGGEEGGVMAATWSPGLPSSRLHYRPGMEHQVKLVAPRNKLRIVTVLQPPFMMYDANSGYSGYCYDLLVAVAEILK